MDEEIIQTEYVIEDRHQNNFSVDTGVEENYESDTCVLVENDVQCGYVFFNEKSRILKFFCTYCRITFDNVHYYCDHLSEHINEDTDQFAEKDCAALDEEVADYDEKPSRNKYAETIAEPVLLSMAKNSLNTTNDIEMYEQVGEDVKQPPYCDWQPNSGALPLTPQSQMRHFQETEKQKFEQHSDKISTPNTEAESKLQPNLSTAMEDFVVDRDEVATEPIVDLDEADEIAAEVEEEMRQAINGNDNFTEEDNILADNSCSQAFLGYDEVNAETESEILEDKSLKPNNLQNPTDFESMIDAMTKDPIVRRTKNKKVTTVKVITVKNRIAELYERIKNEERKRSQLEDASTTYSVCEGENIPFINISVAEGDGVEVVVAEGERDKDVEGSSDTAVVQAKQKIIGETLITLLPTNITTKKPAASETLEDTTPTTFAQSIKLHRRESICPACGLRFRSPFSLSIHKRTHYLESKSSIKLAHKCSDCDQLFNKISELKDHLQKVHYPDGFICKICSKKLTSITLLEKHMRAVHLNRPFSCKICQKSFDSRSGFEAHVDTHIEGHGSIKCRVCGRKYSSEAALNHHLQNHKERKPQTCVVCGKKTLRITQHMKIHTPRPKRILSCSTCGKVFNFSSGLSHHIKIMHKLPRPVPKPRKETASSNNKHRRKPRKPNQKKQIVADIQEPEEMQMQMQVQIAAEEVHAKEEEAKRVIVELIQNASYTSLPDNHFNEFEVMAPPPIAREETISAVNSIVND